MNVGTRNTCSDYHYFRKEHSPWAWSPIPFVRIVIPFEHITISDALNRSGVIGAFFRTARPKFYSMRYDFYFLRTDYYSGIRIFFNYCSKIKCLF